ncbi:hypothetical protein ACVGVM_28410 (plasmid) [Pseudonocardia bannensis]|uniref:Uncharacterized protein n=1 Tax=Pseudonocardia bannensis TaxID=630973 RepID=A0A848DSU2_9PSEU|nr:MULTISPECIES: hypothetical protein [Pseudonocardia]NMH95476.1 hypothetical protein [Pseudonocardia bannensis]
MAHGPQATIKAALPERFEARAGTFAGFDFNFLPRTAVDVAPARWR